MPYGKPNVHQMILNGGQCTILNDLGCKVNDIPQGEDLQDYIHPGAIAEEDGRACFEYQREIEHFVPVNQAHVCEQSCTFKEWQHSPQSLLYERIATSLADDHIEPLCHHDRNEEGCLTRGFQPLSLCIGLKQIDNQHRSPVNKSKHLKIKMQLTTHSPTLAHSDQADRCCSCHPIECEC